AIMAPAGRLSAQDAPRFSALRAIDRSATPEGHPPSEHGPVTFQYITTPVDVAAGKTAGVDFELYIGPKSKKVFESVEAYAQRDDYWVIKESFYFCAPGGLVSLMMRLLRAFYAIPPYNYGIAIIFLVIVVRTILHPITKKSQVNMMKMQKQMAVLQPKIQRSEEHTSELQSRENLVCR